MNEKMVLKIEKEERNTIQALHERINYLKSLSLLVNKNELNWFQIKISEDLSNMNKRIEYWWQTIAIKYNLDNTCIKKYYLNFEDFSIFLKESSQT